MTTSTRCWRIRCPSGNCCCDWTILIAGFWNFGSVSPDGAPRSYAETARLLQISVTRVRRTEARALETLRGLCPQQASAQL